MGSKDLRLLPGRRRWLKRLVNDGMIGNRAGHGQAPMACMRAGWTEWVYRREETNEELGEAELAAAYPSLWRGCDFKNFSIIGERITEAGRAALREREGK